MTVWVPFDRLRTVGTCGSRRGENDGYLKLPSIQTTSQSTLIMPSTSSTITATAAIPIRQPTPKRQPLPISRIGEKSRLSMMGSVAYASSKSDLEMPKSLLIRWRVPVARSRLACGAIEVWRLLAGFTHIS